MIKDLINRIQLAFCCKSKCSLNEEHDYYTNKPKNFLNENNIDVNNMREGNKNYIVDDFEINKVEEELMRLPQNEKKKKKCKVTDISKAKLKHKGEDLLTEYNKVNKEYNSLGEQIRRKKAYSL
tara:strand:- start:30 stop:401 length:372 start_codon:yes stop_codon:yes gene_type:complete